MKSFGTYKITHYDKNGALIDEYKGTNKVFPEAFYQLFNNKAFNTETDKLYRNNRYTVKPGNNSGISISNRTVAEDFKNIAVFYNASNYLAPSNETDISNLRNKLEAERVEPAELSVTKDVTSTVQRMYNVLMFGANHLADLQREDIDLTQPHYVGYYVGPNIMPVISDVDLSKVAYNNTFTGILCPVNWSNKEHNPNITLGLSLDDSYINDNYYKLVQTMKINQVFLNPTTESFDLQAIAVTSSNQRTSSMNMFTPVKGESSARIQSDDVLLATLAILPNKITLAPREKYATTYEIKFEFLIPKKTSFQIDMPDELGGPLTATYYFLRNSADTHPRHSGDITRFTHGLVDSIDNAYYVYPEYNRLFDIDSIDFDAYESTVFAKDYNKDKPSKYSRFLHHTHNALPYLEYHLPNIKNVQYFLINGILTNNTKGKHLWNWLIALDRPLSKDIPEEFLEKETGHRLVLPVPQISNFFDFDTESTVNEDLMLSERDIVSKLS